MSVFMFVSVAKTAALVGTVTDVPGRTFRGDAIGKKCESMTIREPKVSMDTKP